MTANGKSRILCQAIVRVTNGCHRYICLWLFAVSLFIDNLRFSVYFILSFNLNLSISDITPWFWWCTCSCITYCYLIGVKIVIEYQFNDLLLIQYSLHQNFCHKLLKNRFFWKSGGNVRKTETLYISLTELKFRKSFCEEIFFEVQYFCWIRF